MALLTSVELSAFLDITPHLLGKLASKVRAGASASPAGGSKRLLAPSIVREILIQRGVPMPRGEVWGTLNLKGGVGKTTLSVHEASRLAAMGFKVLLVDFDHQANATQWCLNRLYNLQGRGLLDETGLKSLAALEDQSHPIWLELLSREKKSLRISDIKIPISENLDLVKSHFRLGRLEREIIVGFEDPNEIMKVYLDDVADTYNYIIVDLPPSLSAAVGCAYMVMKKIVAPVQSDGFSIQAMHENLEQLAILNKRYKIKPEIRCVVNMYKGREKSQSDCFIEITSTFTEYILPHTIRASADIQAALNDGLTVWELPRKKEAAEDFDCVLKDLLGLDEVNSKFKKSISRSAKAQSEDKTDDVTAEAQL